MVWCGCEGADANGRVTPPAHRYDLASHTRTPRMIMRAQVRLGDVWYTQDTLSDQFPRGWDRIGKLIAAFMASADPDEVLGFNCILVATCF